jgi:hypothetical protein
MGDQFMRWLLFDSTEPAAAAERDRIDYGIRISEEMARKVSTRHSPLSPPVI